MALKKSFGIFIGYYLLEPQNEKVMFKITPLSHRIIQLILNNPIPYRNTDILSPYLIVSITLFFNKFKSVVIDDLYKKGLIELHGDIELFMEAKKASDTKYLKIAASITPKGMAFYKLNVQKQAPVEKQEIRFKEYPQTTLRLVL